MFNCWNGGEHTYNHFYDIVVVQNGLNPKTYIMNIVYNFGDIFDAGREFVLFFMNDPRGNANSVYDAGLNLGTAIYLLITPNIAIYEKANK